MTEKKRVLIADDMHECIIPLLQDQGFDPIYSPAISRKEILSIIGDFCGLIIRSKTSVDRELIDHAGNLAFVARAGAGMDKLDSQYLEEKGVKIINAPEGNRDAVGEHTLGMLLSLLHRIPVAYDEVSQIVWNREKHRGIELKGKTVGVYGVGNMGISFAMKLQGFDCKLIGYDKYKDELGFDFIKKVGLKEFFEKTEILSIHIPLLRETSGLFNEEYLSNFPNLKLVLNTSRGEILDIASVIKLLKEGRIYGVGLDVLENEKFGSLTDNDRQNLEELTSFPNVLITPHVAGWTYESYKRISEVIAEKISAISV